MAVLVHGVGASSVVWRENISALARTHAVYAVDLPGHGKSSKPRDLDYGAVSGAHFLARFMDVLGVRSATLIGNSAGGLVTALCALSYPQRVERLVLVDTAGLGREISWFLRLASLPFVGELLHTPNIRTTRNLIKSTFYEPRSVNDDVVKEMVAIRNLPEAKRAVLKALRSAISPLGLRKPMMILQRLRGLEKPLLLVWGREDRIIPVSHAYRAARVLPHCELHVIPHCGHWPQMERPEEFNRLVLGAINGAKG